MIASLSKASQVFNDPKYSDISKEAADFILEEMCSQNRLMHMYREGEASIAGNLDDYSFLIEGLMELYSTIFDVKYLNAAINLNNTLLKYFWDDLDYGFYFTAKDAEKVLIREKKTYDSATPSGNSVELLNLMRISRLTEDTELETKALNMENAFSANIKRTPTGHTYFISAIDYKVGPSYEVVIVGKRGKPDTEKMLKTLNKHYIPNKVLIFKDSDNPSDTANIGETVKLKDSIDGKATAYICSDGSCKKPTTDIHQMLEFMGLQ
jgi:hypothetical protein